MSIENMTAIEWLAVVGFGIVGGILHFLVTSFINWLMEE